MVRRRSEPGSSAVTASESAEQPLDSEPQKQKQTIGGKTKGNRSRPLIDSQNHQSDLHHGNSSRSQRTGTIRSSVHPELQIASRYMELGKVLREKGEYVGSIRETEKALGIRRRILGKQHSDTAATYYQLGIAHYGSQNYEQALIELKRALTLGTIVWGRDHEDTACTFYQLGIVLNAISDYDHGLQELKKALEIFERVLGKDHEATARTLHHMGDSYSGNDDTTNALVQYGKAFLIQTATLGRHNPQTVETFRKIDHHMRKPHWITAPRILI